MRRRTLQFLTWGSLAFLGFLLATPLWVQRTNCGGNSAALNQVRNLALLVRIQAEERPGPVRVETLPQETREEFRRRGKNHWIPGANFLLRRDISAGGESNPVIAVCDHEYDNVPQPTIWNLHRKNPAHAVAFYDGRTALISPAQFAQMDLDPFVNLASLPETPP